MDYIVDRTNLYMRGKKYSPKVSNNNPTLLKVCTKSRNEDYSAKTKGFM